MAFARVWPLLTCHRSTTDMARWNSCNVLDATTDARHVWQFDASKFALKGEQTKYPGEPLPAQVVGKDWRSLFQQKMNIAWLPPQNVFLRVIHLPKASLDETISMVELQLEKLAPMPVAQVVWTLHILPHVEEGMQTVLVVIASRTAVEEFLGQLEGQGFIADRLEISFLEQLLTTPINGEGAWVYPEAGGAKNTAIIAWWYGGVLRSVDFILLPQEGVAGANLRDQLLQMTWAAELAGWLTSPPFWHLVADETTAPVWEKMLREALDVPVKIIPPKNTLDVAALSARRAVANSNTVKVSLLPPEYAARYRQQFVDRLWMRGLFAVGAVYVLGVLIYLAAVQVFSFQTSRVEKQVADISGTYTNALELRDRYAVLNDRQELKYAALDCWKAVANLLPASMTLESLNFNDGEKLILRGEAPISAQNEVIDFSEALRKVSTTNGPLFNLLASDQLPIIRPNGWSYSLELKRTEARVK